MPFFKNAECIDTFLVGNHQITGHPAPSFMRCAARTRARTHARMHARTHARTHALTHTHTHTHTPTHTHTCVCARIHARTHAHTHTDLEDVGEVSQVEDVVELDGGREERGGDLLVERQRAVHQHRRHLLDGLREVVLYEVLRQDVVVDRMQRVGAGEAECEHAEVSLEARVDREAAGRRVHARHVLRVVDLTQGQLRPVVPMAVVEVLPDQRVRLHREVHVDLRRGAERLRYSVYPGSYHTVRDTTVLV